MGLSKEETSITYLYKKGIAGFSYSYSFNKLDYLKRVIMIDYLSEIKDSDLVGVDDIGESVVFLDTLYILPEYQGQGIFKKMLNILYENCYKLNIMDLFVVADLKQEQSNSNFNIITFYEPNGFKIVKELENKCYLMCKKLQENR